MKRREFITLLGGTAVALPFAASAQQVERLRRIGVLIGVEEDTEGRTRLEAFRKGMHDLDWSEGHKYTDGCPLYCRYS